MSPALSKISPAVRIRFWLRIVESYTGFQVGTAGPGTTIPDAPMAQRPLAHQRVLLLRPAQQADVTAEAVRARGAEPVVFPVIEIADPVDPEAVRHAVRNLESYDWVVFTSANGVERCHRALESAGASFRTTRVAAIGPKTAEALETRGHRVALVAPRYVAEDLARALLEHGPPRRVLLLRAFAAREVLPDLLREAGTQVDVVPVYETRPAGSERAAALRELFVTGAVDVVLFTASSTVSATVDLLGDRAAELLARVIVASIGPVTGETLRERGIRADVTATEHTLDGLLDAVEAHLASRPPS
jgi:uroporphyrinogen III methyltransferase / synthase